MNSGRGANRERLVGPCLTDLAREGRSRPTVRVLPLWCRPALALRHQQRLMATRQIKMPVKDNSEQEVEEVFSQRKRPERGRYLLQVDRQTKNSYTTSEAAQSVALAIKTGYPIVQVSVYDSVEHTHTMVEAPAASS